MSKQATFTEMLNGTAEDYAIIGEHASEFAQNLPNRILDHLSILKGDTPEDDKKSLTAFARLSLKAKLYSLEPLSSA